MKRYLGFGRQQGARALACVASLAAAGASAAPFDIVSPPGSVRFGSAVTILPNGNIVAVDSSAQGSLGAVYLYAPDGITQISVMTGSSTNDRIGSGGVVVVGNGNFIVLSPNFANGANTNAGAVTWVDGNSGFTGPVTPGNSLCGPTLNDMVGSGGATVLGNGNYVVKSPAWHGGGFANAGAATWGNGNASFVSAVSAANSLVGSSSGDAVGGHVIALPNGNYVAWTPSWNNGAIGSVGAVTWGNGASGSSAIVSAANSLVGSTLNDAVSSGGVFALTNGNYVVASPNWSNAVPSHVGAATWGNGSGGSVGVVSAGNSLVGSTANDAIALKGIVALSNGNYTVVSPSWHNGAANNAGAVTWGNGASGTAGIVAATNSLVADVVSDAAGAQGVAALSNGNYVVATSNWHNFGAATWCTGTGGCSGLIDASNSLVGSTTGDQVATHVTALSNGNYVVASPLWSNGATTFTGAATWADGSIGVFGAVTPANSLIGATASDGVGQNVTALSNGNYVVASQAWHNGANANAGAVTWANGATGLVGLITSANSLVGALASDYVGTGAPIALSNGNYVIASPGWSDTGTSVGAATWGNGAFGSSGTVAATNSLIGTVANDKVSTKLAALGDGNFVVGAPYANNGAAVVAGAVCLGNGRFRFVATMQPWNCVRGTTTNEGTLLIYAYDAARQRLAVARPLDHVITLLTMDQIFFDDLE